MKLKNSQIEFIEKDLAENGITFGDLREDLVDHICSEVEQKMATGMTFMDAYKIAIQPLQKSGLVELNDEATSTLNPITMIRYYVTISLRNIYRYRAFSGINILGLSLGLAACFIIIQYVAYELSFDRFHPRSGSVYRMTQNAIKEDGDSFHTATTMLPVARLAKDEYPEVTDYLRLYFLDRHAVLSYEDRKLEQEAIVYADANFFQFFSYNLIKGNAADVLQRANTAVLSESVALKYFDNTDPVGKIIQLSEEFNELTLLVTGVFKDPPANSHLRPHVVVSMLSYETLPEVSKNEWNWPFYMNYIRLRDGADPEELERKLPGFVSKFFPNKNGRGYVLSLQPLEDIHLYSRLEYEIEANGSAQLVFLLLGVALLTLIIAYANYINLSTARSLDRAKEVGIRKTLGSKRFGLVKQFVTEAMVVNLVALVFAAVLVRVFTLVFLDYAGISIDLDSYLGSTFWVGLGIVFVTGAILSSLYPAFILSSFQPISVLRGGLRHGPAGQFLRTFLVFFQFAASIGLMIGAYAIFNQVLFMRSQPLGMDIDNILVVKGPRTATKGHVGIGDDPFVISSVTDQAILNAAVSSSIPGVWTSRISNIVRQGSDERKNISFNVMGADDRFIDTYELDLLAGRNFKNSIDTIAFSVVIINETASARLGFATPEQAVNSKISFRGRPIDVIGVIKDYHHYSLKAAIDPLLIYPIARGAREFYSIRIKTEAGQRSGAIAEIEENWKKIYADNPFEYFFLDSFFDAQYKLDIQFEKMFTAFSLLAVAISCLGLYGLASFVTSRRMKEIGIRKILGSSVSEIVILLLSGFSKLILVSGAVAIPLAYLGIQKWQSQFAFREALPWWVYVLPLMVILLIAVLTISIHAIKIARLNPVVVLKYD